MEKLMIKTIEPNLNEVRKNLILMQQSPTANENKNDSKFFDFYTGKLRTVSQCDSGYSTAESSRKSSLESEENQEDIIIPTQVNKPQIFTIKKHTEAIDPKLKTEYLMKQLLIDIYGRPFSELTGNFDNPILQNLESDCTSNVSTNDFENCNDFDYNYLMQLDINEIRPIFDEFSEQITYAGQVLIRHLKRRDKLMLRRERQYDIITAYLKSQFSNDGDGGAGDTTNMRFSMSPSPGDSGYNQWLDAMKMVSQLPGGIPPEFRKRLWITLAERYLQTKGVNWTQTERACFNEWSNPDDTELGVQIVKDLHRTGCSLFCGTAGQENQALLKRVLLAYARWNKAVGYCQGFNMLAALILQVMDRSEIDSVKVMIYLIEGVLPESYFANNLRGLSVDMAVFRDLLRLRLPNLSRHLDALQNDVHEGTSYEPPLTNVFTMQWFLTLFCNCLPQITVLRVWDLIFLEGNEVLLRTALAIWDGLADRILAVNSADEFYSIMGVLTREMLEFGFMDANTLIKSIVEIQVAQELPELRDKYLYNITPWTQTVQSAAKKGFRLFYSDDDELESDNDEKMAVTTVYGITLRKRRESERRQSTTSTIAQYAYGHPDREKLALDISALKQQYAKLRERQRQAHIILTAACARQPMNHSPSAAPIAMNHLLLGKSAILSVRGRRLGPPQGAVPPSRAQKLKPQSSSKQAPKENGETIHWKDTNKRRPSRQYSQDELQKDLSQSSSAETIENFSPHHSGGDSSSSYSSDQDDDASSSTSTELCDEPGRISDIDELADIPSDHIDSDKLRTNNDVVKSVSESKLDEVKEMANLITHSFSESVLMSDNKPEIKRENLIIVEDIEENSPLTPSKSIVENFLNEKETSPEVEKSYLSNILKDDEEIAQILEKWSTPTKQKSSPETLIDFENEASNYDEVFKTENVSSPQIEQAIISGDVIIELPSSPSMVSTLVKPKFESSRSIEVLRENQTILDSYLKQQGLKPKENTDEIPEKSVGTYSNLFFSDTLCSNSDKIVSGQSENTENSYENNVILVDTKNVIYNNSDEQEPNFDNFVLQRSALSSNNSVNKSGASTPVSYFDFAKYLRDRGIDLSPEDILKIQQSPPEKVYDILEKLTPDLPKSPPKVQQNDENCKIIEPFNLKPNTPETETFNFEQFLEDRVKFIKQLSLESMSSTKARFDSGSDWHKTPSTDDQSTSDRKISISSETCEDKDDVFERIETSNLSPITSLQTPNSDLSPNTLEIIKKYEEIFDTKSTENEEVILTPDMPQKSKARLSFEKQISLDSLSIPEERLETGRRNSELALKIIQENSMILHKILQCQATSIDEVDEDFKQSTPEVDVKSTNLYQDTDDAKLRRNSEIKDLDTKTDVTFKWDPGVFQDNNIEIDEKPSSPINPETESTKDVVVNTLSRPSSFSQLQFPTLTSPNRKKSPAVSPIDNFNPFPVRSTTRQHKDVGLKLGLYKDISPLKSPSK